MKTQQEAILDWLKDYRSITAKQAMSYLGVYRLASRISDIQKEGTQVFTRFVKVKTRWGNGSTQIKEYSLKPF